MIIPWFLVPDELPYRVTDILSSYLNRLVGLEFMECGSISYVPLIPIYRYEPGKVIEYTCDESMAGIERIDGDKGYEYGTGLTIIYRVNLPAEALDEEEKYQG